MAENGPEPGRRAPDAPAAKRLPAPVRFLVAVIAGAAVAALASYLLRKLGL